MGHEGNPLLGFFSFNNVVDNDYEMLGAAFAIANDNAIGGKNTCVAPRHFDFIVAGMCPEFFRKGFVIGCVDSFGIFRPIDFEHSLSQDIDPRDFKHCLKCAIDEDNLPRRHVFHDDGNRNILNDGI